MKRKKIYLKINANCGNQFFQYAFARMLQEVYGGELIIDYEYVKGAHIYPGSHNLLKEFNVVPYRYVNRTSNAKYLIIYLIKIYALVFRVKPLTERYYRMCQWTARHLEKHGVYYFDAAYFPFKFDAKSNNIVVQGYFESQKYFEKIDELIRKELTSAHPLKASNEELYSIIQNNESVCITIKRRDLDRENLSDIYEYDIEYYYSAVQYIRDRIENPLWIIFSDNVDWCRENFHIDGQVYYETPDNPIWEKVRLMSACKHFVIRNSTFSWWVQHLSSNEEKIVVAPTKWLNRDDQPIDIYEDNWVFMRNDGTLQDTHD